MKYKYTDVDFDEMSWHDCPIYSMKFDNEVEFDLDYIMEWIRLPDGDFEYLIAPATLKFIDVTKLVVSIETDFINGLEIVNIERINHAEWVIELQEGEIRISAPKFEQFLRKSPTRSKRMALSGENRV